MTLQKYKRVNDLEKGRYLGKSRKPDPYYDSEPIEETIRKLVRETIKKHSQH